MPLFKTISFPQGIIGLWQFTESTADLLPNFSSEELEDPTFLKYTHEKRKLEWLSTRRLISQLIGPDFAISYLETGKPILQHDRFQHISISHSRDFAAVILHENQSVGIDIEDTSRDFSRIEKRFLSDEELAVVGNNPLRQCLYWCAKEAIFKLVDDQGIDFKKQIHISEDTTNNSFHGKFISELGVISVQLHHEYFSGNCMVWVVGKK